MKLQTKTVAFDGFCIVRNLHNKLLTRGCDCQRVIVVGWFVYLLSFTELPRSYRMHVLFYVGSS